MKALRSDLPHQERAKGVEDLALEARILSASSHRNIVRLRGIADADPSGEDFFVVLDRVCLTLGNRLIAWRKDTRKANGLYWCCFGYCCSSKSKMLELWMERLVVARDLASAMRYLHGRNIIYRDLKPDNVGFNQEGVVKMLDFGLAKRLHPKDKINGFYHLTGNTGSLRYMAPEVAMGLPYGGSVDVYSFGILFWQLCTLKTPYSGYSIKMHHNLVVRGGHRPKFDRFLPASWKQLTTDCWSDDPRSRPDFDRVLAVLDEELAHLATDAFEFPGSRTDGVAEN